MQGEDRPTMHDPDAGASSMAMADLAGQVFNGRYRLVRKVGAGSMGDVYQSERIEDGRTVAIKVLKPEHAMRELFRHRFLREAKSAVPIEHPNVVDVIDFGTAEDGWLYIAMEFLHGEDLSDYLWRLKRLSWRQSCALLQQAASGLSAAHAHGVVHRDVKPSNILLVDGRAGGAHVKIVDFGVAKLNEEAVSRVLTQVDDVVGTVAYMSPEQAEGREADVRSDVYALGVTAYELATGQVPFEGRDMFQVMMGHLQTAPRPPSELVPDFPPAANAFILRCLAKRPEDRFQTMDEVLATLQTTASPDAVSLPPPVIPAISVQESSSPAELAQPPPAKPQPGSAAFDEEPTGYFFQPVQPSPDDAPALPVAARTRQTAGTPGPVQTARTQLMPTVPAQASRGSTTRTPAYAPPPPNTAAGATVPTQYPTGAAASGPSMQTQAEVSGSTMRVLSVPTPVIVFNEDEFRKPAGQMPAWMIVLIITGIVAALMAVGFVVAMRS